MRKVCVLLCLVLFSRAAPAQEPTAYSASEIEDWLTAFKQAYNNKKVPEADAVAALENLRKAHAYIVYRDGKGEASKDDLKAQSKIVKMVCRGLRARQRELVTLQCAQSLGKMGDEEGAKSLLKWMDGDVLDAKSTNPNFVEAGFLSMARIGGDDNNTLDFVIKHAGGKHQDIGVANQALRACYEWRALDGNDRKEFFKKISQFMLSLWSQKNGSDQKKKGTAEKKYNAVKDEGLRALNHLSGTDKPFKNPAEANDWWNDNKKRKWEDFVGVTFRALPKARDKDKVKDK